MFIPHLTDADIDEYLQDPSRFSLRWVLIDDEKARILCGIANILAEIGHATEARDPLEAARGLVALVFNLPVWTQRTHQLSEITRAIRDTLLKASDHNKVLFVDLAALLDTNGESYINALRSPVAELAGAYDSCSSASMLKCLMPWMLLQISLIVCGYALRLFPASQGTYTGLLCDTICKIRRKQGKYRVNPEPCGEQTSPRLD